MKYIGFDLGDGESAVAAFERGSNIEPVIHPIAGAKSLLSAVGMKQGRIIIGEQACTDALCGELSVRFKSRFTNDLSSHTDLLRFAKGVLEELSANGILLPDDRLAVGCPAGWNAACRASYRDLLIRAGLPNPVILSESRAAFLYAKYARTIALDVDILNESALVADIGSSTLDYAYIVDGRETGVGTFGESALGGGMLDAALLRIAIEASTHKTKIEAVFRECRPWYHYCEMEARRIKEEYYTRLSEETNPEIRKTLRICYDGVQKLTLVMNADVAQHLENASLPELYGQSFAGAVKQSLLHAADLTAIRPPKLVLLTGGASRMPFFRQLCQNVFADAIVVSCPEPEFSIAKGLAYAGWVDDNLRAFRETIETEMSDEKISAMVSADMPDLLPAVAGLLAELVIDESVLPLVRQWKCGGISTLKELETQMTDRAQRVLSSSLAQEILAPAIALWTEGLVKRLQTMIDPICDQYEVPRKQMNLQLSSLSSTSVELSAAELTGLPIIGAVVSLVTGMLGGLICGGSGMALLAAGPLGFLAGAVIGTAASLLGWNALSSTLMKADLPLILRTLPLDKRLASDSFRHELKKRFLDAVSPENSAFRCRLTDAFTQAFRTHIRSVAQAAEIPIE